MRTDFPDGSFKLSWDNAVAWYTPDGELKDCEKKYKYRGAPRSRAIPESHHKVREWLAKQGKQEADLLKRRILKRKVEVKNEL